MERQLLEQTGRETSSPAPARNRFDKMEWAGAFGDLGTLIPFVTVYIAIVKMDPLGILLAFGISMMMCGWLYRTPFPVQPMKAIGAMAATQAAQLSELNGSVIIAASLLTGVIWLLLGLTGLSEKIARFVPKEVIMGIVLGLGMSFMLEGAKMMSTNWIIACMALLVVVLLRNNKAFPAMFIILIGGFGYSIVKEPALLSELGGASIGFRIPDFAIPQLTTTDLLSAAIFLVLPQVPLTLGNAIIGIKEENNRIFPDRAVSIKGVSNSTGYMNLFSAAIGGIPMCHGAGGMAAHVSFGARTGGSSIILGTLLTLLALFFSASVEQLFHAFPNAVLGVILFFAGLVLALGNVPAQFSKRQAFVTMATAGLAIWTVAGAMVLGLVLHQFAKRGKLDE